MLPENRYVEVTLKDGSTVKGRILNHDAMSVQSIHILNRTCDLS